MRMAKQNRNTGRKAGPRPGGKSGGRRSGARDDAGGERRVWLYGRHAVAAAIANPARRIERIVATENAAEWLGGNLPSAVQPPEMESAKPDKIDHLLAPGAVHQGLAAYVHELPRARLKEVCAPARPGEPVLVLDQITDPQNIGALFRLAAAFRARAIIVQDRRTPPLAGPLAKAAAGAVDIVACVRAVNISRALEALHDLGYHSVGLAGNAETDIAAAPRHAPAALVLGAEGKGLRRRVAETCNRLCVIPISEAMESLNVSSAAAIALYELSKPARQ